MSKLEELFANNRAWAAEQTRGSKERRLAGK